MVRVAREFWFFQEFWVVWPMGISSIMATATLTGGTTTRLDQIGPKVEACPLARLDDLADLGDRLPAMSTSATSSIDDRDIHWMAMALEHARAAALAGEVPVGAVLVDPATDSLIASGANSPVAGHDPTAHAEIAALRAATASSGNYRLPQGLTLYVTLEPCTMCAGAIALARVSRLVFGATDPKGGAVVSGVRFFDQPTCHWRPAVTGGVLGEACGAELRAFFRARR